MNAGLAMLAIFKNPKGALNLTFALVVMESGRLIFLITPVGNTLLWMKVSLAGMCLMPANFFLFSLIFGQDDPKDALKEGKRYLIPIYLITLLFPQTYSSNK